MKIPTLQKANDLLDKAKELNPGLWIDHSVNVAKAARIIAEHCSELDPETAYILGLLHDIGRRVGVSQMRHIIDGYNYLISMGYNDAARICMTHTFSYKNINAIFGEWDCEIDELKFIENYIYNIEYCDYDLLIQLSDSLAIPSGFCLIEKRMIDTALKFGPNEYSVKKWKGVLDIKQYFEKKTNCSIYTLMPGIVKNTFGVNLKDIEL